MSIEQKAMELLLGEFSLPFVCAENVRDDQLITVGVALRAIRSALSAQSAGGEVPILKPLEWDDHGDEWMCDKGFHIEDKRKNPERWDDENGFVASWGEGEPEYFATLEEAKADCARQWADFVGGQIYAPAHPPGEVAVTDEMVESAAKALWEHVGFEPGFPDWLAADTVHKNTFRGTARVTLTAALTTGGRDDG